MTADETRPAPLTAVWDWQFQGACRGIDVNDFFHPPFERSRRRDRRITAAKAVCAGCPVIDRCREYALEVRDPYGIWGGLSEEERADILGVYTLKYPARKPQPAGGPLPTVILRAGGAVGGAARPAALTGS